METNSNIEYFVTDGNTVAINDDYLWNSSCGGWGGCRGRGKGGRRHYCSGTHWPRSVGERGGGASTTGVRGQVRVVAAWTGERVRHGGIQTMQPQLETGHLLVLQRERSSILSLDYMKMRTRE